MSVGGLPTLDGNRAPLSRRGTGPCGRGAAYGLRTALVLQQRVLVSVLDRVRHEGYLRFSTGLVGRVAETLVSRLPSVVISNSIWPQEPYDAA